jgi:hypothetical protein
MINFDLKGELSFIKEDNPFNNIERLLEKVVELQPELDGTDYYDGHNSFFKAALLLNNTLLSNQSINYNSHENQIKQIEWIIPIMGKIIDLDLPICTRPSIELGGVRYRSMTLNMSFSLKLVETSNNYVYNYVEHETEKKISELMRNEPNSILAIYQINVMPLQYNPNTFEPHKTVFIRFFQFKKQYLNPNNLIIY